MGKPSGYWTSFEELDRQSLHCKRIDQVLKNADFAHICEMASLVRSSEVYEHDDFTERFQCSIDPSKFSAGYHNVDFEIAFSDSSHWVARVRLPEDDTGENDQIETAMLSEITTLRLVTSRTTIPVPTVHHFNIHASNNFRFRYILMQALPGRHLQHTLASAVLAEHLDSVIDQLAGYYHQLCRLRFKRIGRLWCGHTAHEQPSIIPISNVGGPFSASLEYFYMLKKGHNRYVRSKHADDKEWMTGAWILEQALPSMTVPDFIHGPFPLCHMDLHYNNILVDNDFKIPGIIDWSGSQTVPLERFVICPEFVTYPGLSVEQNAPFVAFRRKFAAVLKEMEKQDSLREDKSCDESDKKVATRAKASPRFFISDIIDTPLWEIVYRCTYSYPWRAKTDGALVLRQIFGGSVTWEDLIQYHDSGPLSQNI